MSGSQINSLCKDWLWKNRGESIASEYTTLSLLILTWNSTELNDALRNLKSELSLLFGPDRSFGEVDYYEAREKLGLPDDRPSVPDVFVRAFVRS